MEEYIAPLWIVIFLFLALTVLFILSKLLIIRNKLRLVDAYREKIDELYAVDHPSEEEPLEEE